MNAFQLKNSETKGIWFAVLSGFLYGLLGYFGMTLLESGISVYNLSFWRFFISFLMLLLIFLLLPKKNPGHKKYYLKAFVNGAVFYSAPSTLFFIASQYIGTGQSMVIFFSFPAIVMVLNWLILKVPMKPHYFLSFGLISSGLILLVDFGEVTFDLFGISLSLLSAFSYAFYVFFSKNLSLPSLNSTMMVCLGCCFTSFLVGLFLGSFTIPDQPHQWFNIFALSIISTAIPILLMLEAMKYISSDRASLLSVLEPVFTVIFGILLLGEVMSMQAAFGIACTLLGAVTVSMKWRTSLLLFRK